MLHEMISKLKSHIFTSKSGKTTLSVQPIILDFRKLLLNTEAKIAENICSKDLLHTTVALFDTALPEVTADLIYSVVTDKWARTLVLLESTENVLDRLKNCGLKNTNKKSQIFDPTAPEVCSMFEGVFSDMDSSSGSEEEEQSEPDFSVGGETFVKDVQERRRQILESGEDLSLANVGLEHRLAACATFERCYDKPGHKVLHLTLIAVRKKWRKLGIGKYLMSLIKDPVITTEYDVIIVNADYGAIDFFEKLHFTDDVLANSTYAQIGDTWFHSKRMCYLPAYMPTNNRTNILPSLDLKEMELDITLWKEKSLQCYQSHAVLIQKLRQEILQLRAVRQLNEEKINNLQKENDQLKDEKFYCEQKLLQQRMDLVRLKTDYFEFEEISDEIEKHKSFDNISNVGKVQSKVLQDFNSCGLKNIEITNIFLSKQQEIEFLNHTKTLQDSDVIAELYYCGKGENDQNFFTNVLQNGFSELHKASGEFGKGLYFSDSVETATQFSKASILLIVKVGLGKVQTVTAADSSRTKVPNDSEYDCILTPGRLTLKEGYIRPKNQISQCEYVIFNICQTKPLALVEYKYNE